MKETDTIIFIHIPKTGGTNLYFLAEASPGINDFRLSVPRVRGISPNRIHEDWQGALKSAKKLTEDTPNVFDDKKFISGHFPFGLHKLLHQKDIKYVTLVRHPVERAISSVNFDYQRKVITADEAFDYLMNAEIDNPQTRIIAGEEYMKGMCDEEVLKKAKENIEKKFLLAGITEDTDTFIQVLASIQGWSPFALSKAQITGDKILTFLNKESIDKLSEKHKYDIELYEWVKERWLTWKKENLTSIEDSKSDFPTAQKILCIPPNYAETRSAKFSTIDEIRQQNIESQPERIIEVRQMNHEIKVDKEHLSALQEYSNSHRSMI